MSVHNQTGRFRVIQSTSALVLGLVCLFPFFFLAVLSVSERWIYPDLLPAGFSFQSWSRVFSGGGTLGTSFLISCVISFVVAVISTAGGFVTSKFIAWHPAKQKLLFLAYVPFVMSPVILGTCLMYLYLKAGLTGTVPGVVLSQVIFSFAFAIVLFSAFWNDRMRAYENLVFTLGGSRWQAYRKVLLPVSKEMLLICFFQTFLISWFQYGITLLIGAGKVQTLPLKVYDYVNEANIYFAAVASCLLVIPPAVLLWVNKRFVFRQQT